VCDFIDVEDEVSFIALVAQEVDSSAWRLRDDLIIRQMGTSYVSRFALMFIPERSLCAISM
jgi:hypothetical protein